jgi:hypothetical protein
MWRRPRTACPTRQSKEREAQGWPTPKPPHNLGWRHVSTKATTSATWLPGTPPTAKWRSVKCAIVFATKASSSPATDAATSITPTGSDGAEQWTPTAAAPSSAQNASKPKGNRTMQETKGPSFWKQSSKHGCYRGADSKNWKQRLHAKLHKLLGCQWVWPSPAEKGEEEHGPDRTRRTCKTCGRVETLWLHRTNPIKTEWQERAPKITLPGPQS